MLEFSPTLILVLLIVFLVFFFAISLHKGEKYYGALIISTVICKIVLISLFIANRDTQYGTDTFRYIDAYNELIHAGTVNVRWEGGFVYLMKLLAVFSLPINFLFFLVPAFIAYAYLSLGRTVLGENYTLLFFLLFILFSYPFYYTLSVNVIRHGIAIGFMLLSYKYILSLKTTNWMFFASVLSAITFHKVSLGAFVAVFTKFNSNFRKWVFFLWIFVSLLSYFNLFDFIFSFYSSAYSDSYYVSYTNGENSSYSTGFRFDFWFFSSIPIALYVFQCNRFNLNESKVLLVSCFWSLIHIISFAIPFSDRIGVNSWILYPLIIAIYFKNNSNILLLISLFLLPIIYNFIFTL